MKSKVASVATSIIKDIVVFTIGSRAKFPVKLICCVTLRSASRAYCVIRSIAIIL